jgi:LCP family protein required for cell wall assembly
MSALSPREFLRRFLVALLIVVVVTSVAIAAAYAQAEHKVSRIPKAPIDPSVLRGSNNFLLIGSDSRAFVDNRADAQAFGTAQAASGQRSDTIMVAHIDPGKGTAVLVSFPRDLWVAIPGLGHAKINAAFNAGPQRVIETIEQDFNVPIGHYLQIDFEGFRKMVNAIGTIPIYFPTPARDLMSGLSIPHAGCVNLNGDQALAFVRSRYYQSFQNGTWNYDPTSDLGRIQRQQYFMRTLAQRTLHTVESRPWRANSITNAMLGNLQRDPKLGFSSLRALAYAWRKPGNVETVTLPTHRQFFDGQDALALDTAAAAPLLARLQQGGSSSSTTAPSNVNPSSVHLVVLNGSGRSGLGASVLASMQARGFAVLPPARNADRSNYSVTEVRYAPGSDAKARLVLASLGGAGKLVSATSAQTGGADVALVLGSDFQGLTPAAGASQSNGASPSTVKGPSAATTTTVAPVGC